MGNSVQRASFFLAICLAALPARADEIRLKDGKKLYGVIVSFDDNMFKVKTDFGYVLVEKDKIASIIPVTAAAGSGNEAQAAAKKATDSTKPSPSKQPNPESATPSATDSSALASNAAAKTAIPAADKKNETQKVTNAAVKPNPPVASSASNAVAPATKGTLATANTAPPAITAQPAPPKAPEGPAIRENVQGNLYTNYTHGFRMYKAPSWQLIDDARNALPNAIVAMGTSNESTLMVVGREKTKEPLDTAAVSVENRLHDVYENYQRVSQHKTVVGGSPAIEVHYRGKADEHDWSGTLVVISRGGDIFTVLGMTYADSDLIQIQENVIAKAIASLSFEVAEAKN
jgi:hypothetical protein